MYQLTTTITAFVRSSCVIFKYCDRILVSNASMGCIRMFKMSFFNFNAKIFLFDFCVILAELCFSFFFSGKSW